MESKILLQIGNNIKKARLAKGLSQEQLAEIVELDRTYISLLERGKRNPSLVRLHSLCEALDIKIQELLTYTDPREWQIKLQSFCRRYDLKIEYLADILNDPKVIPMIRGKSFEFTARESIAKILTDKYKVTNPRINAQTSSGDVDVLITNIETGKQYRIECKLAKKGSFNAQKNLLQVKCMRSRTIGQKASLQREKITGIDSEIWLIHNDQYVPNEFEIVITSIGNAFYGTGQDKLYYWHPYPEELAFLNKIGIKTQQEAFQAIYVAKSKDLAANEINRIKCTRQKCKDKNCNFVPNYPTICFSRDTCQPLHPWYPIEQLETLLD